MENSWFWIKNFGVKNNKIKFPLWIAADLFKNTPKSEEPFVVTSLPEMISSLKECICYVTQSNAAVGDKIK